MLAVSPLAPFPPGIVCCELAQPRPQENVKCLDAIPSDPNHLSRVGNDFRYPSPEDADRWPPQ